VVSLPLQSGAQATAVCCLLSRRPVVSIVMQLEITPLILTFNEAPNIERTLERLSWAREIVLIDSGSTDRTLEIVRSAHPNVRIVSRAFDSHTIQWNFGVDQVRTPWVLSLDADYVLNNEFALEIEQLNPTNDVTGYAAQFRYCIGGIPLRASVYPPRTILFQRGRSRYIDDGHTQLLQTDGVVLSLKSKIDHDDRKPFARWFKEQRRYAKIEARHLLSMSLDQLSFQDRLRRKIFVAAPSMFLYLLFGRGLILDGWRGWFYVCQRTVAELFLSIRLVIERRNLEPDLE
jgi:glycosyltransferase involved in cell wall biosynthesis